MAATKTLLSGLKKIEFAQLTIKDKKAYKILFTLSRESDFVKIPLATAIDADTLSSFTVDLPTLLRVGYALCTTQKIVVYTENVNDDDGSHVEYYLHKLTEKELGYSDAQTDGKILKSDTIRPSSAKTASKEMASKEMASKEKAEKAKDDEYIDDKSKKIANAINAILPSYCKIEPSKRALLLAEIEKIIKKEFR